MLEVFWVPFASTLWQGMLLASILVVARLS